MARLILDKKLEENVKIIKIVNENDVLEIMVTSRGYGDIYLKSNVSSFIVDKDNYAIYEIFDKLYWDIVNCNILGEETLELKQQYAYQKIVKNGTIKWYNDDFIWENAPSFTISKSEDSYVISFYKPEISNESLKDKVDCVRVSMTGSKYYPFNNCFLTFFKNLKRLNYNENQIHMEEYLSEKTLVKRI